MMTRLKPLLIFFLVFIGLTANAANVIVVVGPDKEREQFGILKTNSFNNMRADIESLSNNASQDLKLINIKLSHLEHLQASILPMIEPTDSIVGVVFLGHGSKTEYFLSKPYNGKEAAAVIAQQLEGFKFSSKTFFYFGSCHCGDTGRGSFQNEFMYKIYSTNFFRKGIQNLQIIAHPFTALGLKKEGSLSSSEENYTSMQLKNEPYWNVLFQGVKGMGAYTFSVFTLVNSFILQYKAYENYPTISTAEIAAASVFLILSISSKMAAEKILTSPRFAELIEEAKVFGRYARAIEINSGSPSFNTKTDSAYNLLNCALKLSALSAQ